MKVQSSVSQSRPQSYFLLLLAVATATTLAAFLMGCGGSSPAVTHVQATRLLIIAEGGNNRVLIYNAPFSMGQSASVVLGQPDFSSFGSGTTATSMFAPYAVAEDTTGNLYVADTANCRVLQFTPPFTTGMSAATVIGHASFTANCLDPADTFGNTAGIAIDGNGNLWVADFGRSRVLEYKPPFTSGMAPSLAIGQTTTGATAGCNQTNGAGSPTAATLCNPGFIAFDSEGSLWIADQHNSRVLKYVPPFATGMAATLVIGQPGFTSDSCLTSATGLCDPLGVAIDSAGNLWVGDNGNCRVLRFSQPFSSNMAASLELGQLAANQFSASCIAPNPTQRGIFGPDGIAFDSSGNLFVVDDANSRTLVFSPPFSNGMNASLVIGQANFTTGSVNQGLATPTAATQGYPTGVTTAF